MVRQQPPYFRCPANEHIPVWRYIDLTKFEWMLQNKALYFPSAATMNDSYEGHYTRMMAPSKEAEEIFIRKMLARKDSPWSIEREDHLASLRRAYRNLLNVDLKGIRERFYISCWHMNEEESSAMWKLYTSREDSVCVRSTYQQLSQELPSDCYLGCVNYMDFERDMFDVYEFLNFVVHKRRAFEHEKEVRAVINNTGSLTGEPPYPPVKDGKGIVVPIDLARIINEVRVSPDAKSPFLQEVQHLISIHGLAVPVKPSEVNAPPAY